MKFFVYFVSDACYDNDLGLAVFDTAQQVNDFINQRPSYTYTVIHGRELPVVARTIKTRLEVQQ